MKKGLNILIGIFFMFGLFGCGKQKYQLIADSTLFKIAKNSYAQGEMVVVYYDIIATDTNYSFVTDSDDVSLDVSYDSKKGYIIEFIMPSHDVSLDVSSYNSMVYINVLEINMSNQMEQADIWILPDTTQNRKTTIWGTPTFKNIAVDQKQSTKLQVDGNITHFLFRMIDENQMYYSVDGIQLENGNTLELARDNEMNIIILNILDTDGTIINSYEVFSARL